MVKGMWLLTGASVIGALALSCAERSSDTGGETNWACSADVDCTGARSCVDHRCVALEGPDTGAGGASDDPAPGNSGDPGTGGVRAQPDAATPGPPGAYGECPDLDLRTVEANPGPPVSFKNDVMPIFGASCTASDCHKSPEKKAGLYLGVRCQTDPVTKICSFPAAPDPNSTSSNPPMPLTEFVLNDVYANLVDAQATTTPSHQRVVPGSLGESFLLDSLMGVENARGYTDCLNQDSSHEAAPMPCGAPMPLNSPALCVGGSRVKFLTIARWIVQGAPNN